MDRLWHKLVGPMSTSDSGPKPQPPEHRKAKTKMAAPNAAGGRGPSSPLPAQDKQAVLKSELFEHLQGAVERAVWELYTLCEYDANPQQTQQASEMLFQASGDFSKVRMRAVRVPAPP